MHMFDPNIAKLVGVNAAVIYQNLKFWCEKNRANGHHYYDDAVWTYNSVKAFTILFDYLTTRQIRSALDELLKHGLIMAGSYNKSSYDRTKWYSVVEVNNMEKICHTMQIDLSEMTNEIVRNDEPIPDINTYINKENNTLKSITKEKLKKKFVKPDLDAISCYLTELGANPDHHAQSFFDHYESVGWYVGKSPMKCWRAAIRKWVDRSRNYQQSSKFSTHKTRSSSIGSVTKPVDFDWGVKDDGSF